ncbi:MAG: helix-turn-helix domain-containing protein [Myxococcota bacterium]
MPNNEADVESIRAALDRGDGQAARAWIQRRGSSDPWAQAFGASLALSGEELVAPCKAPASDNLAAAHALCLNRVRAAVLRFDVKDVTRWGEMHASLASDERTRVAQVLTATWNAWVHGTPADREMLAEMERSAARAGQAREVVELATLRALSALTAHEVESAVREARRAARMARAEGMPQAEYLAYTVLARVRRHSGQPHLAKRIIVGLTKVAPGPWADWLKFELMLSGGAAGVLDPLEHLDQASESGRAGFDTGARRLREQAPPVAPFRHEVETIIAASDSQAPADAWRAGVAEDPPPALRGILARGRPERPVVFVLASAGAQTKRCLRPALVVARQDQVPAEPFPVARRGTRSAACVAALLLAGDDGVEDRPLFRAVYGFDYEAEVHRGVFDVLKSRLRTQLGSQVELDKVNGRNRITPHVSLAVPDPRCLPSVRSQVLQALAEEPRSAKEVASVAGIALRTAQHALRLLVEEGDCEQVKEGRRVRYILEDTTYSEPARWMPA